MSRYIKNPPFAETGSSIGALCSESGQAGDPLSDNLYTLRICRMCARARRQLIQKGILSRQKPLFQADRYFSPGAYRAGKPLIIKLTPFRNKCGTNQNIEVFFYLLSVTTKFLAKHKCIYIIYKLDSLSHRNIYIFFIRYCNIL